MQTIQLYNIGDPIIAVTKIAKARLLSQHASNCRGINAASKFMLGTRMMLDSIMGWNYQDSENEFPVSDCFEDPITKFGLGKLRAGHASLLPHFLGDLPNVCLAILILLCIPSKLPFRRQDLYLAQFTGRKSKCQLHCIYICLIIWCVTMEFSIFLRKNSHMLLGQMLQTPGFRKSLIAGQ